MRSFDYSKLKEQHWDTDILRYVAAIREHKGRQELYLRQKPTSLERLVEIAKIQSTEASNRIEGIVTTNVRIRELVQQKTTPRNRDEEEILGYRDVLNTIHENYEYIPLRPSYILQLHRDLYRYTGKAMGGQFKNVPNEIVKTYPDGSKAVLFAPLSPIETPKAVESICQSFDEAIGREYVEPLVLIPHFIVDFLCIHPFNDGNGRMSRLLTALLLYRCGYVVGRYISLEKKIEETKEFYYDALQQSDIGWHEEENDYTPFTKYLLGVIIAAYRDFESRMEIVDEKLSAVEAVRRAVEQKIGIFTKSEIMELTPAISKASVENALKSLTQEGVIERHGSARATFYTKT